MTITVPSPNTTVNAYLGGDRIHAEGTVQLGQMEDVIGLLGKVLAPNEPVVATSPADGADDFSQLNTPAKGVWSFCGKGVPGAEAPQQGTATRKLAIWFQLYDEATAQATPFDVEQVSPFEVQWADGLFQPACQAFFQLPKELPEAMPLQESLTPSQLKALATHPHKKKAGWKCYRDLVTNHPASGNRLGDGSGSLRARRIAIYVDRVDWYFAPHHTARITSAAGLGILPITASPHERWKFPGAPMYSIVLHQHGHTHTQYLLAGTSRRNPLVINTDVNQDIFVQVNDVWFPQLAYTNNVGGFDVCVKVLS